MIAYSGILFLGLSFVIVLFSNLHLSTAKKEISTAWRRGICTVAVVAGCAIRLYAMGSFSPGVNAEEALTAVQAKALWQTGGFLFDGRLTTQFHQWNGETGGPLLAFLASPFVGVLGMSEMAVRLPLTLLSCTAMFAAYGIGKEISGERAACWMLVIYALCPSFILNARFAVGANAAVFLMPIAFYALIRGFGKASWLYAGVLLMSMLAYTYDMYFFVVPFVIAAAVWFAGISGIGARHCAAAGILGLLLTLPALLTLWVNLGSLDGFVLLDLIEIPSLTGFAKSAFVWEGCHDIIQCVDTIREQVYAVLFGALFQVMRHENICDALFLPRGILAFYTMSIPVVFLGILSVLNGNVKIRAADSKIAAKRVFFVISGVIVLLMLILVGNKGFLDYSGGTSVFDYSALHVFVALLMTAGLCRIEEKSVAGRACMLGLIAASCTMLCVFIFGGAYDAEKNVHFWGLKDACQRAAQVQEETGYKVYMTSSVYPHMDPSSAAEIMYLYATDADMNTAAQKRGRNYRVVHMSGMENLENRTIYVAKVGDLYNCDMDNWLYEEYGDFALLLPEN